MDIVKVGGRRIEAAKLAACAVLGGAIGSLFLRHAPGTDAIAYGVLTGLLFYGLYRLASGWSARP